MWMYHVDFVPIDGIKMEDFSCYPRMFYLDYFLQALPKMAITLAQIVSLLKNIHNMYTHRYHNN